MSPPRSRMSQLAEEYGLLFVRLEVREDPALLFPWPYPVDDLDIEMLCEICRVGNGQSADGFYKCLGDDNLREEALVYFGRRSRIYTRMADAIKELKHLPYLSAERVSLFYPAFLEYDIRLREQLRCVLEHSENYPNYEWYLKRLTMRSDRMKALGELIQKMEVYYATKKRDPTS